MTHADLTLPAFYADALCLGPHWIYEADEIQSHYPDGISHYDKPRSPYHGEKTAGDFTHYGEQTLALLRSISDHGWSADSWRRDWADWATHTHAYMDGASTRTLKNLQAGLEQPSDSSDLAGASRIAPLFAVLDGENLVQAARAQTALTHGDPQVIDAAEFFARATLAVQSGSTLDEAFDQAASHPYDALPAIDWLATSRQAADGDLAAKAAEIGLACNVGQAFPLTLAIALKHQSDPIAALTTNAMLGGDSASRGLPLGLLMGARHGASDFPDHWGDELKAKAEIDRILASTGT